MSVQGAVFVPFSNPGSPNNCVAAAEVTVRLIVAVWLKLPETPVIVTVDVPVVAVLLAVRVKVLVDVALAGLKLAVTPLGKPEAERLTLPVNPFAGFTVIVLVPLLPCLTVKLVGEAESEKFGWAVALTVNEIVAV